MDSFWDSFRGYRDEQRACQSVTAYMTGEGGRGGRGLTYSCSKRSLGEGKNPKLQNETKTKPKSDERRVSYKTMSKK